MNDGKGIGRTPSRDTKERDCKGSGCGVEPRCPPGSHYAPSEDRGRRYLRLAADDHACANNGEGIRHLQDGKGSGRARENVSYVQRFNDEKDRPRKVDEAHQLQYKQD